MVLVSPGVLRTHRNEMLVPMQRKRGKEEQSKETEKTALPLPPRCLRSLDACESIFGQDSNGMFLARAEQGKSKRKKTARVRVRDVEVRVR